MNYADLTIDSTTKLLCDAYIAQPTHGLLLHGNPGVGLYTLAVALAQAISQHATDIQMIRPDDKGTISIETVRSLYVTTRDIRTSRQVIIVDDIDSMSRDAQNAFLKLLEEPTKQAYFIATTHRPSTLLPTIQSRMQSLHVRAASVQDSERYIEKQGFSKTQKSQQLLFLATGKPAELARLMQDEVYFAEKAHYATDARQFLSASVFERLAMVSQYTDRARAVEFVGTLERLIDFMLQTKPDQFSMKNVTIIETIMQRLLQNGNVRAQMLYLAENLMK